MKHASVISVIIPVYNVRPYLAEALDSVLGQTWKNLEIILIDDGSADGSGEICDAYARRDSRVRVIHQENQGLSCARNAGLDAMTGRAIVFLDPDDAYHPDFVRRMAAAMARTKADLVQCRFTVHKTGGRLKDSRLKRSRPAAAPGIYGRADALRALAGGRLNVNVWNKLYKRELWNDIRFPAGHNYEDIDTAFRIFDRCRTVCVLDTPLYLYRRRPGSITSVFSQVNTEDRILAFRHFEAFIEANTPAVFGPEHLTRWRQARLNGMIVDLLRLTGADETSTKALRKEMRRQVIRTGREIGIQNCGPRTRAAWRIVCCCPYLLKPVYLVYRPIRLLVYALTGR